MNKTWVKNITLNNRNFRLEFYRDTWNLLWCEIYEVYREKKHFFDFSYQDKVNSFWTSHEDTIIEQALEKIDNMFKSENISANAEKALDKFADYIV